MTTKKEITDYFDIAEVAYRDVWHLDDCLALHYGFWDKNTKNLKEALINENAVLADFVGISSNDLVFDAGCGVGGSSIFLAKKFGCTTHGVSISDLQIESAKKNAEKNGVAHLTNFTKTDYHKTDFEDNTFDVVWFLESFGYSNDRKTLLQEAYRVLKPNGRIMISEAITYKKSFTEKEQNIMTKWLSGWALETVPEKDDLFNTFKEVGFSDLKLKNCTKMVQRSAFILYFYAMLALTYGNIVRFFGGTYGNEITIKNTVGTKYQYIARRKKLWEYVAISAKK